MFFCTQLLLVFFRAYPSFLMAVARLQPGQLTTSSSKNENEMCNLKVISVTGQYLMLFFVILDSTYQTPRRNDIKSRIKKKQKTKTQFKPFAKT